MSLSPLVIKEWHISNAQFQEPLIISEYALKRKINRAWVKAVLVAKKRSNRKDMEKLEEELDKFFDITICTHTIYKCKDLNSGCAAGREKMECKK